MENILKQFADLVISSKNDQFLKARIKLTTYYTVSVILILFVFSLTVYGLFTKNITSHLRFTKPGQEEESMVEKQVIKRAQGQLKVVLFMVDSLIVFLVIVFSYYLSGETLKPIERAYERQKKFIADVAHELRTPLAVMKTGAEMALTSQDRKEEREFINDSLEEINFLALMVDGLLFLARNDNLKNIPLTTVNLSELVEKEVNSIRSYAKERNVSLEIKTEGEFYINGNKIYLKRLLTNLLKNAIDYNKPGGKVIIGLGCNKKNQVELRISDTGIGISEKDLKHVFERFYKADQSRSRKTGGTGLGLSIVKEVIKIHKGTIKIKSRLGKGTEVIISLPRLSSNTN